MPSPDQGPRLTPAVLVLVAALLVVQSAYLFVDASPTLFYVGNSFAHVLVGAFLALPLLAIGRAAAARARAAGSGAAASLGWLALILCGLCLLAGLALVMLENTRDTYGLLLAHAGLGAAAVLTAVTALLVAARSRIPGARRPAALGVLAVVLSLGLLVAVPAWRGSQSGDDRIVNPARPPASMAQEAMGGAEGPFFPSSAATSTGGRIPSDFFMTSDVCARCHEDIFEQWQSSAHHFSSFNNQWYRASIEYMQQVTDIEASKWCAGCHDHAVLFNGMMDDPVEAFVATPEAHTGLGCNSCHAITRVKDTMGQGGFHIEYPPLHDLAASPNPVLRWLHDTAIRLDPGPHREVFLRPFHREQTGEFCSSCHKVHLDEPVNSYRWLRGFNEYDNWQASGVSGQGARSFYYPAAPLDCADCHMPRVPSEDAGNIDGFVHDHSFLAANTALPVANLREDQLRRTIEFLQRNQVTVDILAAGPARPLAVPGAEGDGGPRLSSTFAVGEESAMQVGTGGRGGGAARHEPAPVWGPLDAVPVSVRRGEDARVDVVVRTRGVGHFFPGGTVDAHEVWLELHARDDAGRTIFWSGVTHDGGEGIVDPGAQFYRAKMIDGHGNPIDRRNAVHTRAVVWVNLIPPGAADVAHYRLSVPADCGDEITLEARLNYRKFTHVNTRFAFAGRPADGEPARWAPGVDRVNPQWDDREFVYDAVPADVSAELLEIPVLPIVVMDRREATLRVVDADPENPAPEPSPEHALRWNDYGIGLLRQGDLQGAQRAFELVTSCDPGYADGYVNLGRVALREGLLDDAADAMGRALDLEPDLAKAHYFTGVVLKERGRYDEALAAFRIAAAQYPRDRVVLNAIGRVRFLQRNYEEAVETLQSVLAIDPEDLMAHYNLMLCYKGLGRLEDAEAERQLYERFKADEDANILLGPYLRANPEDNRMRQPIREQVSAPRDVIQRELALRAAHGDPHAVLPGEAAEYARRTVERGRERRAAGHGSDRHAGPVDPRDPEGTR